TLANVATEQQVLFAAKTGQYVRLRALTEVSGKPYTSMAELNVLASGDLPPDSTIQTPSGNTTVTVGQTVNFTGSGNDPDNDLPLSYHWIFGDPSIPDSFVASPGAIQFNNPGYYTVTFTV